MACFGSCQAAHGGLILMLSRRNAAHACRGQKERQTPRKARSPWGATCLPVGEHPQFSSSLGIHIIPMLGKPNVKC